MIVLVTGADGQLGRHVRLRAASAADRYLFVDAAELDITDRAAVEAFVARNRVEVIVNCAAYTDVERAESEEERARAVNATAVGYLAAAARANDALLIHLSTDYVFMGGCCSMIPETAQPRPINAYGRTKLAGEEAVAASGCHHLILRTAWLYSEFGTNFVRKILQRSERDDTLRVVADQIGSPTYAGDLADAIVRIISERRFVEGIYHYTNLGTCSWWEFAREICRLAGRTTEIQPCTSAEYPSRALRPMHAVLDKTKFRQTFGWEIPHWRDSLKRCIDGLQA